MHSNLLAVYALRSRWRKQTANKELTLGSKTIGISEDDDAHIPDWCKTESVHNLLRKVLKGNARLPSPTDEAVGMMSKALSILAWETDSWRGPWMVERVNHDNVWNAIAVLVSTLPSLREEYLMQVFSDDQHVGTDRPPGKSKADLAAIDALISAARIARERRLPITFNMLSKIRPEIRSWKDVAVDLQDFFQSFFPDQPKAAAYRFVVEVVPLLFVGDKPPTLEAVKTALKRKRHSVKGLSWGKMLK